MAVKAPVKSKNTPVEAARVITAHIGAGFPAGTKTAPSTAVLQAQVDMGGVTVDGIWGPKTKARADFLLGVKPASVSKSTAQAIVKTALAVPRTPKQAALDLQTYLANPANNRGKRGATAVAVKAAQRDMGMPVKERDGIYGPVTQAAMTQLLGASAAALTPAPSGGAAQTPVTTAPVQTPVPASVAAAVAAIPTADKLAALTELQNFMGNAQAPVEQLQAIVTATPELQKAAEAVAAAPPIELPTASEQLSTAQSQALAPLAEAVSDAGGVIGPFLRNKTVLTVGFVALGAGVALLASKHQKRRTRR